MSLLWGTVLALHLLGIIAWLGGMLLIAGVLFPHLPAEDDQALLALLAPVLARFVGIGRWVVPVVLVSGYLVLFGFYGLREAGWSVQLHHLLGLGAAGIFARMALGPWPALRTFPDPAHAMAIRRLLWIGTGLGAAATLVAAWGHFG